MNEHNLADELANQYARWLHWTPEHNIEQWLKEKQERIAELEDELSGLKWRDEYADKVQENLHVLIKDLESQLAAERDANVRLREALESVSGHVRALSNPHYCTIQRVDLIVERIEKALTPSGSTGILERLEAAERVVEAARNLFALTVEVGHQNRIKLDEAIESYDRARADGGNGENHEAKL